MSKFDVSIKTLSLDKNIIDVLENNNVSTINDLWAMNRSSLRNIGLIDSQINKIIIKLELLGIDLGKKINKV